MIIISENVHLCSFSSPLTFYYVHQFAPHSKPTILLMCPSPFNLLRYIFSFKGATPTFCLVTSFLILYNLVWAHDTHPFNYSYLCNHHILKLVS